jgi:uncharacterized membrane protein HdeD (DUF308 family)
MKKIWFKAKRYGWGWYPATWQGWLVVLGYLAIFAVLIAIFETNIEKFLVPYLVSVFIITSALIFISYKTGEKPGWRWGDKEDKK